MKLNIVRALEYVETATLVYSYRHKHSVSRPFSQQTFRLVVVGQEQVLLMTLTRALLFKCSTERDSESACTIQDPEIEN